MIVTFKNIKFTNEYLYTIDDISWTIKYENSSGVYILRVYNKEGKQIFSACKRDIFCTMTVLSNIKISFDISDTKVFRIIEYILIYTSSYRNIVSYQNTSVEDAIHQFFKKSQIFIKTHTQNSHYGTARQMVFLSEFEKNSMVTSDDNYIINHKKSKAQRIIDYKSTIEDNPVPSLDKHKIKKAFTKEFHNGKFVELHSGDYERIVEIILELQNGVETDKVQPKTKGVVDDLPF